MRTASLVNLQDSFLIRPDRAGDPDGGNPPVAVNFRYPGANAGVVMRQRMRYSARLGYLHAEFRYGDNFTIS
jgi:hypothetical protein